MPVGRKPKHPNLKLVEGNPGRRPLPENLPEPQGDVARPDFLRGREAELWDHHAPELIRLGLLTFLDAYTFGAWCCLMAEFVENPGAMSGQRMSQMRGIGSSFGMDPSARVRLAGVKADDRQKDPAEAFFA